MSAASAVSIDARARPWTAIAQALGIAGLLVLLAASVVLVLDAAAHPLRFLVPAAAHRDALWAAGPLRGLGLGSTDTTGWRGFGVLLCTMTVSWLLVMACAKTLAPKAIVATIVAGHVIYLLAPPLLSSDIMGYIGFAREGVLHGTNPYQHGWAIPLQHDAIHRYLGWHDIKSAYGPLFTIFSYALVPLGIHASVWIYKIVTAICSLAICRLVWTLAVERDVDPRVAVALVGLNPVTLAFEVGGGHNDALTVLLGLAGVALILRKREVAGMAAIVAGAATKISMGVVAPFALIGSRDRRGAIAGGAIAFVLTAIAAIIAFGGSAGGFVDTVPATGNFVASHAVPVEIVHRTFGHPQFTHSDRTIADLFVVAVGVVSLIWTWRGGDWLAGAGFTLLAILLGTVWLLPWYTIWLLPFAALGRNRWLWAGAIGFSLYVIATRVAFLLA